MIDGDELDQRARKVAKMLDEADINDFELGRELLKQVESVRKDFSQWIEENASA